jgi:hypothetical protein
MAKVLGIGGIFFKSPDPSKLNAWYAHFAPSEIEFMFNSTLDRW